MLEVNIIVMIIISVGRYESVKWLSESSAALIKCSATQNTGENRHSFTHS
jgi:hypothetical protein